MRRFNLKGEVLIEDPRNQSPEPGRAIYPEQLRMAEPGWVACNYAVGEREVGPEGEVTEEMMRAAREWLAHVEARRIG